MCNHDVFLAKVEVNKLEDTRDGDSIRCAIDLRIWCDTCKTPLLFSLPLGLNLVQGATMSIDGEEARIAGRVGIPKSVSIMGFGIEQVL